MNSPATSTSTATLEIKRPKLHHVNLKTTRMSEMIAWYNTVIGGRKQFQSPIMGFLTNDHMPGRIALLSSPELCDDPQRAIHIGMHHSAFEYDSVDDLLQSWVRLKGEGIEPHACLDHGFAISYYYVDPDGNSVELQADWFGDPAVSGKFMESSPEFASNPIGKFVAPEKMVDARAGGMSIEELHARSYAGEFEPAVKPDFRIAM